MNFIKLVGYYKDQTFPKWYGYYHQQATKCTASSKPRVITYVCPKPKVKGANHLQGFQYPINTQVTHMQEDNHLHASMRASSNFCGLQHTMTNLWVQALLQGLLHQAGDFMGMPGLLLGYHDTIKAWMTTEWVINASPTHLGLLHSLQGLQDHLQGLQHHQQGLQRHQQGLQHLQQSGGFKIHTCGYKDLINWVQGDSRHKPTL